MTLRCWQCGVESRGVVEVTGFADLAAGRRRYLPTIWPEGDHGHAVDPPTPAELVAAGDAAMCRIIDAWTRG